MFIVLERLSDKHPWMTSTRLLFKTSVEAWNKARINQKYDTTRKEYGVAALTSLEQE